MPGFGWHAYGLAVDYVFDGNLQKIGLQWSWDDADLTKPGKQPLPWKRLGGLGASLGLEWAGYWKHFPECPHFQSVYGLKITQVYNILINEGLPAVWKILDKK
ncbi:M15 family metallopeptidase [Candidatus Desantisbacteria bacterium]|nr:M15 family metallopeptidase [Candidatus Desantisbacteria bacterium]